MSAVTPDYDPKTDYEDPRSWRDIDPEIVSLFGHGTYYQQYGDEGQGMTLQELLGDVE